MASSALFPIMVKVWAGKDQHDFRYIRRSIPSLLASGLPENARIIVIDDQSPDPRIGPYFRDLAAANANLEFWTNSERLGPNKGQEHNFPLVVSRFPDAPYFLTCDDDVIYHPGWMQRLIRVHEECQQRNVQGVFSALNIPARPHFDCINLPTSEVLLKRRQPALNWMIPRETYETIGPFRDTGVAYDTDYGDRLMAHNYPVVCMRPSYVQNIGYHGMYQYDNSLIAHDYVGRRDMYLWLRDCGYTVRRHTIHRVWDLWEKMPESGGKQMGRHVARRVRGIFTRPKQSN